MSSAWLDYDVVDVFAERPFAGNQLAVVHGAEQLSAEQCLALAREFGYSETTFPVPLGHASYSVRIFTPAGEIPFAGHPTLGTADVLRGRGELSAALVVQRCGVGEIEVGFDEGLVSLRATPRDLAGPVPDSLTRAVITDLGLAPSDLVGEAWLAGTGLTFLHVPVRPDAVSRARVPSSSMADRFAPYGDLQGACVDPIEGIDLYAVTGADPVRVHARVFVPGLSVPEDPATGSSAASLGLLLAAQELAGGGEYVVRQGLELGRPSLLHGRVDASATSVWVAGAVHPIASGRIACPPARD